MHRAEGGQREKRDHPHRQGGRLDLTDNPPVVVMVYWLSLPRYLVSDAAEREGDGA
jgi:hypothetical protein